MAAPQTNEIVERAYCLNLLAIFGKVVISSGTLPENLAKMPLGEAQAVEQTVKGIAGKLLVGAEEFGLLNFFSVAEKSILVMPYSSIKNQSLLQATWRTESLQVLLWALSIIDKIPDYGTLASDDVLGHLHLEKFNDLRNTAKLRDANRIETERELAELWHWRSRTRQLIKEGRPFPAEIPQFNSYDEIVRLAAKAEKEKNTLEVVEEDFAVKGKAYRDLTDAEWSEVGSIAFERHFSLNWLCGRASGNDWDKTPTDT